MTPPASPHSLLIVDDEPDNLDLLENVLGEEWPLHRAGNASEALAVLGKTGIDLVLSDQRMPGKSGVEFLEQVRIRHPDTVRMLITAYPDIDVAVEAINRGQVKRYIPKPFDPEDLRVAVRQELEHFELLHANRNLNKELGRMVRDLTEANHQLREVDRMKDEFLASITHELKTPLVSGIGYIDLMRSEGLGTINARQKKGLSIAFRNLQRLLALIEDLLSLARYRREPHRASRKPIDLAALIQECIDSLRGRARKKKLDIRCSLPADLPPVMGEEPAIHSVFTNILSNAEKFTPEEARIAITVSAAPDRCTVKITDNGIGLPSNISRGSIRPFEKGTPGRSRRFGGLGIGLMLCREILRHHGATLRIRPRPKAEGTEVQFDLPLRKQGGGTTRRRRSTRRKS